MRIPTIGETTQANYDLEQIRRASLDTLMVVLAVPAIAWILLLPWDVPPHQIRAELWFGVFVLWAGIVTTWLLRRRYAQIAALVLIATVLSATVLLTIGTGMSVVLYGLIIPILITSIVLRPSGVLLVSLVMVYVILHIGYAHFSYGIASLGIVGPVTLVTLVTAIALLSAHSLNKTLVWVSISLEEAWQHAEVARTRSGELVRALKALDESAYRIERLNQQLQLALEAAREAEEQKTRFAASVSHELRTPLNLIVGFSGLLFEHPEVYDIQFSSRCLHDLSIIYRNALQLQSLVNDVLDLAQIHAVRMVIKHEAVDLITLVHEVADTVRGLVESKGLDLTLEMPSSLPAVWADRTRIRQVLVNLLSNAVRFTDQGYVKIQSRTSDGVIFVAVEDSGVGISESDLPQLFKEFHELSSSLSRRFGGTGLGLAISKAFVELHGGQIWAESEVGRGSTFTFSLPVDDKSGNLRRGFVPSRLSQSRRESVVVVLTHSERALRVLQSVLVGWRMVMAQNVGHALRLVHEVLPQWLIVDRNAVSIEEQEDLRGTPTTYHLPILFSGLPQDIKGPIDPMVRGFIMKPVSSKEIYDVLRQFGPTVERILVVDDDRDFAQLLTHMLTLPPRVYRVLKAHSGGDALRLALEHSPDVIILDLGLPDFSGEEFMQRIRQEGRLADVPIIIVTGQVERESGHTEAITADLSVAANTGFTTTHLLQHIQRIVGPADYPSTSA